MFLKVIKYISFITFPLSCFLFVSTPELIEYILGDKWLPVVPALRILCFYGLLRSLNAATGDLFKAVGDPKYLRDISLAQLVILLVLIVPATKFFGIIGVSLLVLYKGVIATILAFKRAIEYTNTSVGYLLTSIWPQAISAVISIIVVAISRHLFTITPTILGLNIVLFSLLYLGLVVFLDKKFFLELKDMIPVAYLKDFTFFHR